METKKKKRPSGKIVKKKTDGRNKKGKFIKGNKAAEKWTDTTTLELLNKIWGTLTEGKEDEKGNVVRANDIKTLAEVCLMHDVDPDTWAYLKDKFKESNPVLRLIKKILWVLEARLVYGGTFMDIFVLKNHYEYKDKKEIDATTKGESLNDNGGIENLSNDEKLALFSLKQKMRGAEPVSGVKQG